MDTVGKVYRRRASRKILDLSGRGKAIYTIRKQIQITLKEIHEFLVIGHITLPFQNLAQPGKLFLLGIFYLLSVGSLFIFPVCRNTILCRLVHLIGTNLDLEGLAAAADQGSVQGLIHICLRHGDVILKTSRDRLIHFMNHAKCRIAILHTVYNNTNCKQIINLIYGLILVLHLFINTEEMLYTTVNLCLDPGIFNMLTDLIHNILNIFFTDTLTHRDLIYQIIICFRLQIFQRKIVQFHLDLGNTQTLCNGRIDLHGFPCDSLLAFRFLVL